MSENVRVDKPEQDKSVEELETLTPTERFLVIGEERIVINKIKTRQLFQIMELASPFYTDLQAMKKTIAEEAKNHPESKALDYSLVTPHLYKLILSHGKDVVAMVAVLVEKPEDWVQELELDSLVELLAAVLNVNIDFFTQKVLPSLLKLVEDLGKARKNLGGEYSNS